MKVPLHTLKILSILEIVFKSIKKLIITPQNYCFCVWNHHYIMKMMIMLLVTETIMIVEKLD